MALAVARQAVLPVAAAGALVVAALGLWAAGQGPAYLPVAASFAVLVLGIVGSFALHECAHLVVLRRCRGLSAVVLETTWTRLSVRPEGRLEPGALAAVALSGPLTCAATGLVLVATTDGLGDVVGTACLAHLLLLAPCFGDGAALVTASRQVRRAHAADLASTGAQRR